MRTNVTENVVAGSGSFRLQKGARGFTSEAEQISSRLGLPVVSVTDRSPGRRKWGIVPVGERYSCRFI